METISTLNDALSLEYKREYGHARGHFRLPDLTDEALLEGPLGILGLLLEEELPSSPVIEISAIHDDVFNPVLVSPDRLESLSE